jgi:DNA-binding beta-propeller fold protein YncE
MALNNGASTAYVVNSNITTTNGGSVSVCPVNTDGTFGSCTTATTGTLDDPFGIALNPANTFAYVTQLRRDNVLVCPITGGTLGTCSDTGGTGFDAPYSMAINNAGTIAFIVNKNSDSIYRCTINPDGTFARCSDTGATSLRTPQGIAFNSTGTMVWITTDKQPNNDIITCQVNAFGFFTDCQKAIASRTFSNPIGIVLNAANSIAYIADFNNGIYSCSITANGTFSSCTQLNSNEDIVGLAINH